jgi:hypothetical protein
MLSLVTRVSNRYFSSVNLTRYYILSSNEEAKVFESLWKSKKIRSSILVSPLRHNSGTSVELKVKLANPFRMGKIKDIEELDKKHQALLKRNGYDSVEVSDPKGQYTILFSPNIQILSMKVEGSSKPKTFSLDNLRMVSGKEALSYIKDNLKLLDNSGRTRIVFDLGSNRVLKFAKNSDGLVGNKEEVVNSSSRFTPTVVDYSKDFEWVVVEKLILPTESSMDTFLKSKIGLNYWGFLSVIGAGLGGKTPSHSKPTGNVKKLKETHHRLVDSNLWYKDFCSFIIKMQLDPFELHLVNLGFNSKGDLVVLDLGPSKGK